MSTLVEAAYPLSPMQQGLLFHSLSAPGSGVYVAQVTARLTSAIDPAALERAWQLLMERHEILRASFVWDGVEPLHQIHSDVSIRIERRDWRDVDAVQQRAFLERDRERGFDLAQAPLMRLTLCDLPDGDRLLVWTHHHILLDGRARVALMKDVAVLYEACATGRPAELPPPAPFRSYVEWLRRQDCSDAQAFWQGLLGPSDVPVPLALGGSADVDRAQSDAYRYDVPVSPALQSALRRVARAHEVTLNILVQAAWAILLSRYTGQESVVFGATRSCRRAGFDDIGNLVGVVMNTVPHHVRVDGDQPFASLVAALRAQHVAMRRHEQTPLLKIRDWCGVGAAVPLFDSVVVFEERDLDEALQDSQLALWRHGVQREVQTHYGITLSGYAKPALRLELCCHPHVCSASAASRLRDHFVCLLESIAADPAMRSGDLPMLTTGERRQLLEDWNATSRPVPDVALPVLFENQVRRTPSAPAVVCEDVSLTYTELNERANRLARLLIDLGIGPEATVGVVMPRSVDLVVALLATLKAGGVYLPLDPHHPPDRLASILDDARPACLLSTRDVSLSLPSTAPQIVVDSIETARDLDRSPAANPTDADRRVALVPDNLAYILFTSGSTGAPKGVAVSHGSIVNKISTIVDFLGLSADTRFAATSAVGFDPLFDQILCPLAVGGVCCVVPDRVRDDAVLFAAYAARHRMTVLNGTPGYVQHVMAGGTVHLDTLMIGGDVLPSGLLAELVAANVARRILNLYGPTETCINASAYDVPATVPADVPIGAPLPNYRLYVLDRRLNSVPIGVAGDLYIAGAGLARGYINRPALTAARFPADPHGAAGSRMYRTGDRARWRADGQLEFLGRVDRQVKVRGVRIEPAEIERALDQHPAIARAVVTARARGSGETVLAAYVVSKDSAALTVEELRRFLLRRLPPPMIPDAFVFLRSIPLTPLAKVDFDALPPPKPSLVPLRVARTSEEQMLCDLFAEVLALERVEVDESFFALGGHSLLATRLASRIRAALGVEVAIATLFEAPTPSALARCLHRAERPRPRLTRQPRPARLPLSYAQQRLWFIDLLEGGSPEYNATAALRLRGPLNREALKRAIQTIVDRHESLRTHFEPVDDEPRQVIAPRLVVPFVVDDLRALDEHARDVSVRAALAREREQPFVLTRGPLLRVRLLQLDTDDHVLVRTCHHIVWDGWSQGIFNRELGALYDAYCSGQGDPLPPVPVQYADFALWQRASLDGDTVDEGLTYWTTHLADAPERLVLPADRPRPAQRAFRAGKHDITISSDLLGDLKRISQQQNATLFMTLLGALAVLFARYSGEDDIVIGSPVAGRREVLLEQLLGFFLNMLALRVRVRRATTFADLLAAVRQTTLDAYRHQDVPFERVVEALMPRRSLGTTPVVQALLVMQAPAHPVELTGLSVEPVPGDLPVHHDVEMYMRERGGCLHASWAYDVDLFDSWRIEQMARHYEQLLRAIVADQTVAVGRLSLLTAVERLQLLTRSNESQHELKCQTLVEMFEVQVRRTPKAVALITEAGELSYRDLAERAGILAHVLIEAGAGPECVVGIALDRSPEMVVALLAVLLAGAAYLPLDPEYPAERLRYMVEDAAPLLVISTRQLKPRLPDSVFVRCLDDPAFVAARACAPRHLPTDAERGTIDPDHPAYVIFTSGSTGLPKGVVGLHGGAVNRLGWFADRFGFSTDVPVLARSSISFIDGSTELLGPLLHGGSVVLANRVATRSVVELRALIDRHGIGTCTVVPSLLRELLEDEPVAADLGRCRRWLTSGEPLSPADVMRFRERLPGATLVNLYGASEASGDSLFAECHGGDAPIGTPIWNTQVHVLNADLEPVPAGVSGELYLGGVGLARGYLNKPGPTAERFVPNPFGAPGARFYRTGDVARWRVDGALEYIGRVDRQVKLRGFRVELGEIESALRAHPAVADAGVVMQEHMSGRRLAAYVILHPAPPTSSRALRQHLQEQLPDYMVPATVTFLQQWPLTATGKLDRHRLPHEPQPDVETEWSAPRTPDEKALCDIFCEVLGCGPVGRDDDFFDLGGHSLLLMRLVNRIHARLGVECSVASVFDSPSAASLAVRLRADVGAPDCGPSASID